MAAVDVPNLLHQKPANLVPLNLLAFFHALSREQITGVAF
jgi:hypothetical protein